ncbi:hypothetical protein BZA05DRAFT_444897 [Tricharina praecox]|uniref:uncharacterized protein n=1 Tax=Tricharina praecox TaxID=43433 RepID=UPI00221FFB86|nr:uncharacterized protein BZA05DRAFT_444897 [Tricharina praecox]KAI5852364.1 hypothetical protein BZA05DRAFT_444897 [Tricharina praecox]
MVTWNHQADARLLWSIITTTGVKLDNALIAETFGMGVTPKAIQNRIHKLKQMATVLLTSEAEGGEDDSPPPIVRMKARKVLKGGSKTDGETGKKATEESSNIGTQEASDGEE